jgi:hypothetical protein
MIMNKYDLNEGNEALKRVLLMMKYDNKKTLVENTSLIFEQNSGDLKYFQIVTKSIMKNPDQIKNIDFGSPTNNFKTASNAIKKSVEGLGTTFGGLDYVLLSGFTNIGNSIAIIKYYPTIGGESIYDALNEEMFAGGTMTKIVDKVANQLMEWCSKKPNVGICQPKSEDELKYGKI